MNTKELIDALADKTECTRTDAYRSIGALLEIITVSLKEGETLTLVNFQQRYVKSHRI